MVLLKGRDDLEHLTGLLGRHFRSVTLDALHSSFLTAASDADRSKAAQVLEQFYNAAGRLHKKEREFNKRARPSGRGSLTQHLRSPEHFAALREFEAAKESLVGINPRIGRSIAHLVTHDMDMAPKAVSRSSAAATS